MTLKKAGSGSVDGRDFNAVVDELDGGGGGTVTAADIDSQAAQDGDVLTADGAGGASWEAGGGGSQPFTVRVPIAFDTPNLAVQSFPQVSADAGTSSFVIAGDHTTIFPTGGVLTATSDNNSGQYTVFSSSFGGGNTTIVVGESVNDEGATGEIINAANGVTGSGIEVYVPTAGDIWLAATSYVSVTTAFDGTTPTLSFYGQGATDYAAAFGDISAISLTSLDVDETTDSTGAVMKPASYLTATSTRAWSLTDTTPIRAVIDDGSGGAPGSVQGEGEIVLFIVAAS